MVNSKKTVVVKPTNNCNFFCGYCYSPEGKIKMSEETLKNILTKFPEYYQSSHIKFLWHGGEPLMMGKEFYESIVELQKGKNVRNSIQTNLSLLDENYVSFFRNNKFGISFSLDGPKEINDLQRYHKSKKGTFDQIMKNVEILKKGGYEPRAIAVISKLHKGKEKETYEFFRDKGIHFKLHPLVHSGRLNNHPELYLNQDEYTESAIKFFNLWFNDKKNTHKINIEPLFQYIGNLITQTPGDCSTCSNCQDFSITVTANGDVYPCWRFDENSELLYGNINTHSIEELLNSPLRKELLRRRAKSLEDCAKCDYLKICNAGCMNHSYLEKDIFEKDSYCKSIQEVYTHIKKELKKLK